MIDRLAILIERLVAASEDDPLVLAAGALVGIIAFAVLAGLGLGLSALVWAGRPWSLIALPIVALGIGIVSERRGDPEK